MTDPDFRMEGGFDDDMDAMEQMMALQAAGGGGRVGITSETLMAQIADAGFYNDFRNVFDETDVTRRTASSTK